MSSNSTVAAQPRPRQQPRCDFCGAELGRRPYLRVPCRDFTRTLSRRDGATAGVLVLRGYWAACRRCSPLVQARDWPRLINRSIASHEARFGRPGPYVRAVVRSELAAMYLQLHRFMGEPVMSDRSRAGR